MYKIAFIYGGMPIYWDAIILTMAELTGIVLFLAACLRKGKSLSEAGMACTIGIMLSLILTRLVHWYFRPNSYGSFGMAMTDFFGPGHALMGAFAGCLLTAYLLQWLSVIDSATAMLDCMSFGGCAAIALGRLSCLFTPDDRGAILQGVDTFPWTYPALNPTSGALEYRFATFFFQSVTAACIFAVLLLLLYKKKQKTVRRDGDVTLLFLLMYCASQIVWDSTRYDSLRLRRNGFIGAVQLLCALTLAAVLVIFSIRVGKTKKRTQILCWLGIVLGLGTAGYMEYYAQIRGDRAAIAYTIMGGCMVLIILIGFYMCTAADSQRMRPAEKAYCGKFCRQ